MVYWTLGNDLLISNSCKKTFITSKREYSFSLVDIVDCVEESPNINIPMASNTLYNVYIVPMPTTKHGETVSDMLGISASKIGLFKTYRHVLMTNC